MLLFKMDTELQHGKRGRSSAANSDKTCKKLRPNAPDFDKRHKRYVSLCKQKARLQSEYGQALHKMKALIDELELLETYALGCKSHEYHAGVCAQIRDHKQRKAAMECEYKIKLFGYNTCLIDLDFGAHEADRASNHWTADSWVEYEARHKPGCVLLP